MPILVSHNTFRSQAGFFVRSGLATYGAARRALADLERLNRSDVVCGLHSAPAELKDGLSYWKELARTGAFIAHGKTFEITEHMLSHWVQEYDRMIQAGHSVPVPVEHTTDPEKNRGTISHLEVRPNGRDGASLWGVVTFADADAAKLAKTAQVSVFSPAEFIDGEGRKFVRPLRHVALTDYPVIPGLEPFSIVASLVGDTKMPITLPELVAKHEIEVAEDATPEDMLDAIDELITSLKKLEPEPEPEPKSESEPEPEPVAASMLGILRKSRVHDINDLVSQGRISPVVARELQKQYCNDNALALSLTAGNEDDSFDRLMSTLAKQPATISMSETTGPQVLDPKNNPLLADACRRAGK